MAYRPYIWRKNNPEKRLEQKRREKVRTRLRQLNILPPYGEDMTEEQNVINHQISVNDFSYWDSIKQHNGSSGGTQITTDIKSPEYLIWYRAKNNAKEKQMEFNLEIEDIIIPTICPYLGVELFTESTQSRNPNYYSVDRIDSTKGYIKGNIQIISLLANTMKNNATINELINFCKGVIRLHGDDLFNSLLDDLENTPPQNNMKLILTEEQYNLIKLYSDSK
jgi:hypothetical protein